MKKESKKIAKNIIYNSIGSFMYLFCQWLMTFIVVWVSSYNTAGILSISMSIATTYIIIATFNMRNYQSSDINNKYSEKTYLITRLITTISAILITFIYSLIKGFTLFQILCINVFMLYKVTEAIVDVLHGSLQKKWRFDIIGKSFFIRGTILILTFSIGLLLTNNLLFALVLVTISTYIFIFFYDIKHYKMLINNYGNYKKRYTFQLLMQCVPMVIYGLIFSYISLYPKIVVENILGTEQLGYYASVATPALIIQVAATFIFNPLISLFAEYYQNSEYKKFKITTIRILFIIIILGLLGLLVSNYLGYWGLTLLFGKSIAPFVYLFNGVIVISTLTAIIWFLGMLLVVKRNYKTLIIGAVLPLILTLCITKTVIKSNGLIGINIILIIVYILQSILYLINILTTNKTINNNNNGIYYIRSTSIINDSRATKEIKSLLKNNYNVYVLGWDRDKRVKDKKNVYVDKYSVKCNFFNFQTTYGESKKTITGLFLFQFWLLFMLIKDNKKYKCIHACDFDCVFISNIISILYNKKLVYDMYDYYTDSRPMSKKVEKVINKLENNIINNSDISIICGEWRKEQIKGTNPRKLLVIHNTPEINDINSKKIIKSNSDKLKIAYIGILQDHRLIMEVLNELKNNDKYELHIGGFGKYESIVEESSKKYKNIFYYGSLKYNEVLSLESDCDILFATYDPSIKNHKFSAPNKIYEAMALSKPIIVCKNTGVDTIIEDNKIGLTINYDANEFMKSIQQIDEDRKIIKEMGKKANKLYKSTYNWQKMENILIEQYNNLMKG